MGILVLGCGYVSVLIDGDSSIFVRMFSDLRVGISCFHVGVAVLTHGYFNRSILSFGYSVLSDTYLVLILWCLVNGLPRRV